MFSVIGVSDDDAAIVDGYITTCDLICPCSPWNPPRTVDEKPGVISAMLDICNGAARRGVKGAHGFVSTTREKPSDMLKGVCSAEVMGVFSDLRSMAGRSMSSGEEKAGLRIGG